MIAVGNERLLNSFHPDIAKTAKLEMGFKVVEYPSRKYGKTVITSLLWCIFAFYYL